MSKSYQHLSAEERAMLQIERGRGQSVRAISRILGRSPSTLSRELAKQDSTTLLRVQSELCTTRP
ncbi:helix-turn-helix domain-containing protein, partial [Xanthomonas oryzae]|uniref:helix-turn-helix domain-containing protein n=1 Tax=Xanthomonas oryzae TaxID=347 RepID=UPI000A50FFF2